EFERRWEMHLPLAFRQFCLTYNGGVPASENEFYPVPERFRDFRDEYDVVIDRTPGIIVAWFLSMTKDPEPMTIEKTMQILMGSEQLPAHRIPIADDGLGNYVMLSVDRADFGRVYFEDHELPQEDNSELNSQFLIADTLEEFLEGLTYDPEDAST